MKKIIVYLLCAMLLLISASGCGYTNRNNVSDNEILTAENGTIVPDDVPEGSEADINVRKAVAEYIDTFVSCDFDAIKNIIHEEDTVYFNFESEDQMSFYKTIFPKITYDFEFVSEHEGVYGAMTHIYAPDMAEVYGTVITDYIDSSTGTSDTAIEDIVSNNTQRMLDLIASPDISIRDERLYVYVQHINGEYIVRCDPFFANALTGGAPEVSSELTSAISEAADALNE